MGDQTVDVALPQTPPSPQVPSLRPQTDPVMMAMPLTQVACALFHCLIRFRIRVTSSEPYAGGTPPQLVGNGVEKITEKRDQKSRPRQTQVTVLSCTVA